MKNALISRRRLIWSGLLAGGAIGAGGLAWLRDPAPGFQVLAPGEKRIIQAIAEVMFPDGNAIGISWQDADLLVRVDDVLTLQLPAQLDGIRYLLRTLEIGTLMSRGQTFSESDLDVRTSVLEVWANKTPFARRIAMDSLKVVMSMAYFNHPAVLDQIGWRVGCRTSS